MPNRGAGVSFHAAIKPSNAAVAKSRAPASAIAERANASWCDNSAVDVEQHRQRVRGNGEAAPVPAEEFEQHHEDRRHGERRDPDQDPIVTAIGRNRRRAPEPKTVRFELVRDRP